MQMTDSDFTLNDWRRRLGGGGAVLYLYRKDRIGNWGSHSSLLYKH